MQVFFLKDIAGVARKGEVKNVKNGYFLNFLSPRKLASKATPAMIKESEKIRANEVIQSERLKSEAKQIAERLNGVKLVIKAKADGTKLYGSITEKDILDELEKSEKIQLEKSSVSLSEHIKVVGQYEIPLVLTEGVVTKIVLDVKGEK